nr:immunoglobulin heavy chain junction region [Mus musculus]NSM09754.1 immunoglobulin heavy chain junction region [Mus musculus]
CARQLRLRNYAMDYW